MNKYISLILASTLALALTLILGCSEKCGGKEYDPETQFCANKELYSKCKGEEYNPETHFCHNSINITEKCSGKEYNPSAQFCHDSNVADKCGGNAFNPSTQFCAANHTVQNLCNGKEYDPASSSCSNGKLESNYGKITDTRDGKTYKTVRIGEQVWFAENLNFDLYGDNECYGGKQANCKKYGRLYIWEDAMKSCPNGWRLPDNEEWDKLFNFAGGREIAGKFLKAKSGWEDEGKTYNGEDKFGFAALPGGIVYNDVGYNSIGARGSWWSSSKNENSIGYYCRMEYDDVNCIVEEDANSLSVRCVKD